MTRELSTRSRVVFTVVVAILGSVAVAGPMIESELFRNPQPGVMRIFIGAMFGVMGIPFVMAATWRKPLGRAGAIIYIPALASAIVAAIQGGDEDYSFFYVGLPMMYVTALLCFIVLPERATLISLTNCPHCGYDRRGDKSALCPECGLDRGGPVAVRRRFGRWTRPAAVLLGAVAVSGVMHLLAARWLLSLG